MQTTYEMIKKLPGKGFDWEGFCAALRADFVANNSSAYCNELALADRDAMIAQGIRGKRRAAMEFACSYVSRKATRQAAIAPSDESRMWDSFEGGHRETYTDRDAEESATAEIAAMIAKFE